MVRDEDLVVGGWFGMRIWKKVVGPGGRCGSRWLAPGEDVEEGGYLKVRMWEKVVT